jgi:hypothetical protein
MIDKIINFLRVKTDKDRAEEYLADASNLVDLENRLRQIDRNQAPWQIKASRYNRCWVQQ